MPPRTRSQYRVEQLPEESPGPPQDPGDSSESEYSDCTSTDEAPDRDSRADSPDNPPPDIATGGPERPEKASVPESPQQALNGKSDTASNQVVEGVIADREATLAGPATPDPHPPPGAWPHPVLTDTPNESPNTNDTVLCNENEENEQNNENEKNNKNNENYEIQKKIEKLKKTKKFSSLSPEEQDAHFDGLIEFLQGFSTAYQQLNTECQQLKAQVKDLQARADNHDRRSDHFARLHKSNSQQDQKTRKRLADTEDAVKVITHKGHELGKQLREAEKLTGQARRHADTIHDEWKKAELSLTRIKHDIEGSYSRATIDMDDFVAAMKDQMERHEESCRKALSAMNARTETAEQRATASHNATLSFAAVATGNSTPKPAHRPQDKTGLKSNHARPSTFKVVLRPKDGYALPANPGPRYLPILNKAIPGGGSAVGIRVSNPEKGNVTVEFTNRDHTSPDVIKQWLPIFEGNLEVVDTTTWYKATITFVPIDMSMEELRSCIEQVSGVRLACTPYSMSAHRKDGTVRRARIHFLDRDEYRQCVYEGKPLCVGSRLAPVYPLPSSPAQTERRAPQTGSPTNDEQSLREESAAEIAPIAQTEGTEGPGQSEPPTQDECAGQDEPRPQPDPSSPITIDIEHSPPSSPEDLLAAPSCE